MSLIKHELVLIFLLSIVILTSGCTIPIGPNGASSGGGIVIEFFGPDIQVAEIFSNEPINFQVKFRNTGSQTAQNVFAELLGLDESWCCNSVGLPSEGPWTSSNEKLPNEVECRYTGLGESLSPPNQQMGTTGEDMICTWSFVAPSFPKNIPSVPYTPTARIYYTYDTTLIKSITFGSHQDIRAIQDIGGTLPASTTSTTSSPVSITMDTKSPIRFWTSVGGGGEVTFPIDISIVNSGGGMACASRFSLDSLHQSCKRKSGEESKNKVVLKITPDSGLELNQECYEFINGKVINLYKGDSNSISCDVTARGLKTTGPIQKSITIEAHYEYAIDTETSIRVVGNI
jgi:hypothetical protein